MFDRILLPTDGSEAVTPAAETAFDVAKTYGATLHVLFVVEPPQTATGIGEGFTGMDNLLDELEQEGQRSAAAVVDRAEDDGIEAESAVRRGNPRDDILEYATEHDIDLIVMGTHGRTGVKRTLLGSVTEGVVRHAETPVLTVHREPAE